MSEFLERLKKCVEQETKEKPGAKKLMMNWADWRQIRSELQIDEQVPVHSAAGIDVILDDSVPADCIIIREERWY
jgi:hypothetical protein